MPSYRHTQSAPLLWLSSPIWLVEAAVPMLVSLPFEADCIIWGSAIILMLVCWQFSTLTFEEQGDSLAVWFGRVKIVQTRVRYEEIISFAAERTSWLDGWGLHYVRGGWLYNVWGFDCVRITTAKKTVRLGTDDVDGLLQHLKEQATKVNSSEHEA